MFVLFSLVSSVQAKRLSSKNVCKVTFSVLSATQSLNSVNQLISPIILRQDLCQPADHMQQCCSLHGSRIISTMSCASQLLIRVTVKFRAVFPP